MSGPRTPHTANMSISFIISNIPMWLMCLPRLMEVYDSDDDDSMYSRMQKIKCEHPWKWLLVLKTTILKLTPRLWFKFNFISFVFFFSSFRFSPPVLVFVLLLSFFFCGEEGRLKYSGRHPQTIYNEEGVIIIYNWSSPTNPTSPLALFSLPREDDRCQSAKQSHFCLNA